MQQICNFISVYNAVFAKIYAEDKNMQLFLKDNYHLEFLVCKSFISVKISIFDLFPKNLNYCKDS